MGATLQSSGRYATSAKYQMHGTASAFTRTIRVSLRSNVSRFSKKMLMRTQQHESSCSVGLQVLWTSKESSMRQMALAGRRLVIGLDST